MKRDTARRSGRIVAIAVLGVSAATTAGAATIQGSLRYDGLPVTSTFTTMTSGGVGVYDWTAQKYTFGTVNLAANSYSVPSVPAGNHSLFVRLSASDVGENITPSPADLYRGVNLTVAGEVTITKDLDLYYTPHVTQPLDSKTTWPGSCTVCPEGTEVAKTFTLAWEPVPLATSYTVDVRRYSCTGQLGVDSQTVTGTSVQVTQQKTADESFVLVDVNGYAGATQLTVQPFVAYTNCWWQTHGFHASGAPTGRQVHPTSSRFLPQIARLAGQPPTFWKTDLFLTNPTSSAVTVTLRYTPRDVDGTVTNFEVELDLPAHASRTVVDVLGSKFSMTGAGSLEIVPATVEAACRNYTPGAGPGFYGQGYLPLDTDQLAWIGGPAQRLGTGGVAKGAFRSNLSLTEVWGEAANVRVVVLDRDGVQLGETAVALLPFGTTQLNDVVGKVNGPSSLTEGQVVVEVTSGGGRVGAVLSLVDNGSQDPSTLPLVRR